MAFRPPELGPHHLSSPAEGGGAQARAPPAPAADSPSDLEAQTLLKMPASLRGSMSVSSSPSSAYVTLRQLLTVINDLQNERLLHVHIYDSQGVRFHRSFWFLIWYMLFHEDKILIDSIIVN